MLEWIGGVLGTKYRADGDVVASTPGSIGDADTGFPDGGVDNCRFTDEVGFEQGGFGGPGLAAVGHDGGVDDGEERVRGAGVGGEADVAPCVFVGNVGEAGGEVSVVAGAGADGSACGGSGNVDDHVLLLVEDAGDERGDEEINE